MKIPKILKSQIQWLLRKGIAICKKIRQKDED